MNRLYATEGLSVSISDTMTQSETRTLEVCSNPCHDIEGGFHGIRREQLGQISGLRAGNANLRQSGQNLGQACLHRNRGGKVIWDVGLVALKIFHDLTIVAHFTTTAI